MKHIILIIFLFSTINAFELSGEVETLSKLKNSKKKTFSHKTIIKASNSNNNLYSEFSIISEKTENTKFDSKIYRAFLEYYKNNYTFSAGKQKINWGNSYFFNYSNIFNSIDIDDPKREHEGIKSISLKYNNGLTKRIETVINLDDTKPDYAFRYTFTNNITEFMINYLDHYDNSIINNKIHSKDIILEFKGEKNIGYWGQIVFKSISVEYKSPLIIDIGKHQNIYVLGIDYTYSLKGRNLYTLAEMNYNKSLAQKYLYLNAKYNISEDIYYIQNYMSDLNKNSYYYSSIIQYLLNDSLTVQLEYNKYFKFNLLGDKITNNEELGLRLTTYF